MCGSLVGAWKLIDYFWRDLVSESHTYWRADCSEGSQAAYEGLGIFVMRRSPSENENVRFERGRGVKREQEEFELPLDELVLFYLN